MAYLVDVGCLDQALGEQLRVSGDLAIEPVDFGDEHFEPTGPAHFEVTVTNTGSGLVLIGDVSATMHTTCARCCAEFDLVVDAAADGFYVDPGHAEGVPEEQEIEFITDQRIDIQPALADALLVELPLAPICHEDCEGLCPVCGADLNTSPCACSQTEPAGPFAALKDIAFDEGDEDETGDGGA